MRKRQYKKNARCGCPRCSSRAGFGNWCKTPTGRWIEIFLWCFDCRWKRSEDKRLTQEVTN